MGMGWDGSDLCIGFFDYLRLKLKRIPSKLIKLAHGSVILSPSKRAPNKTLKHFAGSSIQQNALGGVCI